MGGDGDNEFKGNDALVIKLAFDLCRSMKWEAHLSHFTGGGPHLPRASTSPARSLISCVRRISPVHKISMLLTTNLVRHSADGLAGQLLETSTQRATILGLFPNQACIPQTV